MDTNTQQTTAQTNPQITIPKEIRPFLEELIKDANLSSPDADMQEGMIQELYERLDSYLASVIVEKLHPEDIETFIKMNEDKKSREEIQKFLQDKLPNAQDVFAGAFIDFRDLYVKGVADAKNAAESTTEDKTVNNADAVPEQTNTQDLKL